MNDRFKFRCWIKKYKKLVDVYRYGNDEGVCQWIWHSHIYDTPDGKPVIDNWGSVDERFSNIIEKTKLIDCILEQCTGLKDKNGKLIYDGDIIKSPSNSNVLRVYQEDSGLWRCVEYRVGGRKELPLYQLCDYGVEILGNIHENEELYND